MRTFASSVTASLQVTPLQTVPPAGAAPAGGGAANAQSLAMTMQQQEQDNWCWSAVATSVGLFFQTGNWTQCGTANGCLNLPGTDCCADPGPCNVYGYLDQSLTFTRSFNQINGGTATAAEIQAQIGLGDPVCARVAWDLGGAHFLSITGFSSPDPDPDLLTIELEDPFYGSSTILLADFPASYQGGGTWTHTYLTQAQP